MAERRLDLVIRRRGRKETSFEVTADPADSGAMRDYLTSWLEGEGWARGLWSQFELTAFNAGTWDRVAKVRL
jgi:hypothetical protein